MITQLIKNPASASLSARGRWRDHRADVLWRAIHPGRGLADCFPEVTKIMAKEQTDRTTLDLSRTSVDRDDRKLIRFRAMNSAY